MSAPASSPPQAPSSGTAPLEASSGKGAGDENFPVGSLLISPRLRPHVARYYAFARAADDVGDDPVLPAAEKIARLARFAAALKGEAPEDADAVKAHLLRESLLSLGIPLDHGLDLLSAFTQDATKTRYANWAELMDYCRRSATPVGRYLLDLHGEDRAQWAGSDALCDALQVINHLQDCQKDCRDLDRVYLPQDWLAEAGATVADLDRPALTPGLRRVLDRCLDGTEVLLRRASPFPHALRSTRLALESAVIIRIAWRLCRELRARDPLAERVELSKPQLALCAAAGVFDVLLRRQPQG